MTTREGIRPPKFADQFHLLDFDSDPMPVISLFPFPEDKELESLALDLCGLDCQTRTVPWSTFADLPQVRMEMPLTCSIFSWAEVVEWEGVRLGDFLKHAQLEIPTNGYLAFYSNDGVYFESIPAYMAEDPLVLLATGLNGHPLPREHGGPLRLVVPFLQGYKSVKWVGAIRAFSHDPSGIKRLLGQSKTGLLGLAWRERFGLTHPEGPDASKIV